MDDSKEKARSGIITWLQGRLSERSGAFKCLSLALICIIIVLALRLYHAGGDVWGVVYQLLGLSRPGRTARAMLGERRFP